MAGNIATEAVARSKPDGYTILIAPASSILVAGPFLFKKLNYDPINDFASITTLAKLPFILIVPPDVGVSSVAELTGRLKDKGEGGFYGSSTTVGLVASELYKTQFGLKTTEVKYKSGLDAINDLMAHNLDFFFTDPVTVKEMVETGKVKALAVTSAQRIAALPKLPSAAEAGISNLDLISWWSVHVPAKTPRPVIDKLSAAIRQEAAGTASDTSAVPRNALSRRLLGLIRTAFVDRVRALSTPDPGQLLRILHAIEVVGQHLEADWSQHFTDRLSAPDGLELVVEVARRAGFGDDERMRRAFMRHLGVSPSEYRSRFSG